MCIVIYCIYIYLYIYIYVECLSRAVRKKRCPVLLGFRIMKKTLQGSAPHSHSSTVCQNMSECHGVGFVSTARTTRNSAMQILEAYKS